MDNESSVLSLVCHLDWPQRIKPNENHCSSCRGMHPPGGAGRIRLVDEHYALDHVSVLAAVAVGQPGRRTFFISLGHGGRWYRLWLEKEELLALAIAIRRFLFALSQRQSGSPVLPPVEDPSSDAASGLPSSELEVEELTLAYEDGNTVLDVVAHRSGPKRADKVSIHSFLRLGQLRDLGNQADRVCAAGRPRCSVCGQPIDPSGHACPGNN